MCLHLDNSLSQVLHPLCGLWWEVLEGEPASGVGASLRTLRLKLMKLGLKMNINLINEQVQAGSERVWSCMYLLYLLTI